MFQTEYDFTLPLGYVDKQGSLHREGIMRLATAGDEIGPLRDERVQRNPAYLTVILLSRVVTRLGDVEPITPATIEGLFAADLEYLQTFYNEINRIGASDGQVVCPECRHEFEPERDAVGGSLATPSTS
jgi:phage FluMu protein gp41